MTLVTESESVYPPSVGGEPALSSDVLEDRKFELECLATALPRFASMLLCPEGDPDALDIPTPRSYAEAITGEYSSQWHTAMDTERASWKSTDPYVDEVPPPGQRQGVDFFQTFSPTPKMTTLRVQLHVAAQCDYELHSLDFSTTFLQGSLHEEIWLRHPPCFTGSFPAGSQSLPSLPRSPAPPCLPCVERRQRAAPHSSEFPPTTAPLQTLHMDVWGPAPVGGTHQDRYFLLVVDDYTRYTTVFPLRRKADVSGVLIPWIHATRRQLRERFGHDFPVLRLHSDRGGVFSSDLLAEFCQDEGIVQSFTLPASPQKNGIAERRIGLIMEVAHTSMIHAAAPHFLWSFAVRYAAHQLNLWPRGLAPSSVSQVDSPHLVEPLEISSDSSGPVEGVDPAADDMAATRRSPRLETPPGFPPRPSSPPLQPIAVDYGAEPAGAEPGGAEIEGEGSGGAATGGAATGGAGSWVIRGGGGYGLAGAGAASPGGTAGGAGGATGAGGTRGATGHGGAGATSPRGATGAGARGTRGAGGAGGAGPGGALTGGAGAAGASGAARARGATRATGSGGTGGTASAGGARAAVAGHTAGAGGAGGATGATGTGGAAGAGGAGAGGTGGTGGARAAGPGGARTRGAGAVGEGGAVGAVGAGGAGGAIGATGTKGAGGTAGAAGCWRSWSCWYCLAQTVFLPAAAVTDQFQPQLLPGSPLPALAPPTEALMVWHFVLPPVPQRVVLLEPPASSLLHVPDLESDLARAASPTITRLLATVATDPDLESTAAFSLVTELVDFASRSRLDYVASLVNDSESVYPSSVEGELALGNPDALDTPTPHSYAEAIAGEYSSQYQTAMDACGDSLYNGSELDYGVGTNY
ncbi:unnamed protein product [Closterium sp. NIES-54]